jgi:hypothetical protein
MLDGQTGLALALWQRMRKAILIIAVLAACHPPSLSDRAHQLASKAVALGSKTVAVVGPHVSVVLDSPAGQVIKDHARAAAVDQIRQRTGVDIDQPIAIHAAVVHEQSVAVAPDPEPAPVSAPAPMPAMTVTRVVVAPHAFFGLQHAGHCTRYETLDSCNRACTALHSSCSCLEEAPGC